MVAKFKKNQKSSQTVFFSLLLGVLVFSIVGFLIVANWKINQKRSKLTAQIESLYEEIRVLTEQQGQLQAQVSQTSNLEKEARERLNLKKAGEEVVVVLPAEEQNTRVEQSFWQEIWDKIKFW